MPASRSPLAQVLIWQQMRSCRQTAPAWAPGPGGRPASHGLSELPRSLASEQMMCRLFSKDCRYAPKIHLDTGADDLQCAEQQLGEQGVEQICCAALNVHCRSFFQEGLLASSGTMKIKGLATCCAAECAPSLLFFFACSHSGHRDSSRSECGSPRATSYPEPIPGSPAASKPPRPPAGGVANGITHRDVQLAATASAVGGPLGSAPPGAPQATRADSAVGGDAEGEAFISWATADRIQLKLDIGLRRC